MRGNGISRCKGLAVAALSFALVGLPAGARAAPAAPADTAFCGALFSDYIFRGVTQSPRCAPPPTAEPVKLNSVGTLRKRAPSEPATLYSVGTLYHPFVALAVGGGRSKTNFDVEPPVNFNGTGFVFDINGGVLFNLPGTPISIGPRIGWQGSNISGSIENPPTGFLYDVRRSSTFYQEALLQFSINPGNSTRPPTMFPFVTASAGIAEFKLQFTGTSGAFQVTDSPANTGFTGTIGFGMPIYQTLPDGTLAVFTEARFIKTDAFVKLPGRFQTNYQSTSVTAGFRYQW